MSANNNVLKNRFDDQPVQHGSGIPNRPISCNLQDYF